MLVILAVAPFLVARWLSPATELWRGQGAGRTWSLKLTEDRFDLTISTSANTADEHVNGTFSRDAENRIVLYVDKPGKAFFMYPSGTHGLPDDVGYQVFLNWRSKPTEGTEFCFTCCDTVGRDHCFVMHRQ